MIPKCHRQQERQVRHRRVRARVAGTARRPRFSVFCSNRYLYAQLIDDDAGRTLAAVNDLVVKSVKTSKTKAKIAPGTLPSARALGEALAAKAKAKKIATVVFDRGGYRYTGRIKTLADGARAGGL